MTASTVVVNETDEVIEIPSTDPPSIQLFFSTDATSIFAVTTRAANYSILYTDQIILGNASSVPITLTLPTAVGHTGVAFIIKKIDMSINAVTLATTSGQLIDGASSRIVGIQNETITVVSNGANWYLV